VIHRLNSEIFQQLTS